MKKVLFVLVILFALFTLTACPWFEGVTRYPDMVEYQPSEILEVAKEKYSVTKWIYTDYSDMRGEAWYDKDGVFQVESYQNQYSLDFVNGDNIEKALTSFAGKEGGRYVQGQYSNFLCYVALGECADGKLRFVYFNTNINKNEKIADTIGASDYPFEVSPTEINDKVFEVPSHWHAMILFLNKFKKAHPRGYIYSGNRLTLETEASSGGRIYLEFYKEEGEVVFDVFFDRLSSDDKERQLVYSTSNRYGVIYNYYGLDKSQYFDITQTVTQSTEQESCMSLKGKVKAKEIEGEVLYSQITYTAEYYVLREGEKIIMHSSSNEKLLDTLEFEKGWMIDKIDGVDHTQTAKFILSDFYIFYEKKESHTEHFGEWQKSETSHFYQYTCGCESQDIAELHSDYDENFLCDICGYVMEGHKHTYKLTFDQFTHCHFYTCGCETPPNSAPHYDEDEDGNCDLCQYVMNEE